MTRDRMLEIVAAMRSPEGCACSLSEMSDAFLMLADLAGIGQPADVDLDGFEARAMAALPHWGKATDGGLANREHVAHAHPAAVLALVARCRRAEARAVAATRREA